MEGEVMEIEVTCLDGSIRRVQAGTTIGQLTKAISSSLSKRAIAGKMDKQLVDLDQSTVICT